jgi:hypothetical protein
MRLAYVACVSSLVLAGCASTPKGGLPDGTYRAVESPGDALVVDGNRITVYLPTLHREWKIGPYGREFTFRLDKEGILRLWGSSNDPYFLQQGCDWRFAAPAIECAREGAPAVRFVRDTSGATLAPATPEQRVWLAVATRVRENDRSSARRAGSLPIYFRTTFPSLRPSITQLEKQARPGFCGLSRDASSGVVRSLRWLNRDSRSIGDVFDHRPGFVVAEGRRRKDDQLGLSNVVFNREGDTAYVSADLGGRSGSIVQVKLADGEWRWAAECATWASWR